MAPLLAALAVVAMSVAVAVGLRGSVPVRPTTEGPPGPRFLLAADRGVYSDVGYGSVVCWFLIPPNVGDWCAICRF